MKMCPHEHRNIATAALPPKRPGFNSLRTVAGILLIFVFSLALATAFAENRSEEYLNLKNWTLPDNAVPLNQLKEGDKITYPDGKPFSGVAFENYPKGRLLRAVYLKDSLKNGLLLLWYPDGSPQMSANYKADVLNGRFLGWYANGSVIYDLMLNNGVYAGDVQLDNDESRQATDTQDTEREGPDNDKSPE